jgi:hypothetical protein
MRRQRERSVREREGRMRKGEEDSHVTWVPHPHVPGMLTQRHVMRISLSKESRKKIDLIVEGQNKHIC